MCLNANQKPCCVTIALLAILVGIIEFSYDCIHLALYGMNKWLVGALIAWIPIFIAAVFLIIGTLRETKELCTDFSQCGCAVCADIADAKREIIGDCMQR
ncbi:uncharacterized protein Dyak_GE27959, isoform B [Drosophila yakuba]|uniref:Uncharacterized protein, isoform B n=1 Tax=Drosophila yakuba TaxID=7245 RepID=A0A0R1DX91_DROYA|nr:uncharacterized protein Dyak_GE27959, isoform B [Drosophila yakuba]